jgi:hypothetical protein
MTRIATPVYRILLAYIQPFYYVQHTHNLLIVKDLHGCLSACEKQGFPLCDQSFSIGQYNNPPLYGCFCSYDFVRPGRMLFRRIN